MNYLKLKTEDKKLSKKNFNPKLPSKQVKLYNLKILIFYRLLQKK